MFDTAIAEPAAPDTTADVGKVATPMPDGSANIDGPASGDQAASPDPAAAAATTLARFQSERDTARNDTATITAERDALKAQLEEIGDPAELEYEIQHERDTAWIAWADAELAKGVTLQQLVNKAKSDLRVTQGQRQQTANQRESQDDLITVVEGYDRGLAKFLRSIAAHGTPVTQGNIKSLKETYQSLKDDGNTPVQAAAAVTATPVSQHPTPATPASATPPVAPTVPQPGNAQVSASPLAPKGQLPSSTSYFKQALGGLFGTTMERRVKE